MEVQAGPQWICRSSGQKKEGVQSTASDRDYSSMATGTGGERRSSGFFSILYLKKIKISKIYGGFEKFQNYTPVAPCLGDRGPVALWLGDRT